MRNTQHWQKKAHITQKICTKQQQFHLFRIVASGELFPNCAARELIRGTAFRLNVYIFLILWVSFPRFFVCFTTSERTGSSSRRDVSLYAELFVCAILLFFFRCEVDNVNNIRENGKMSRHNSNGDMGLL